MSDQTDTGTPDGQTPFSVVEQIPLTERKRKTWLILGGAGVACLSVWCIQYTHDQLGQYWWYVWPIAAGGLLSAFIARFNATKTIVTEAGKAAKLQKQLEAQRRHSKFLNKLWVRYPAAMLILWGAAWAWTAKPEAGWLALCAAIYALWLAREVAGLLLVGGGVYLLFRGVAALPVSVAVVIGAFIIANAVGRK